MQKIAKWNAKHFLVDMFKDVLHPRIRTAYYKQLQLMHIDCNWSFDPVDFIHLKSEFGFESLAELNGESLPATPTPDAPAAALAAVAAKKVSAPPEGAEKSGTNVDGFVFHRRKARNTGTAAQIEDTDPEVALAAIEQEMLATRQLYLDGVISKDVYVAETRNLYGKAQQKM